jgi:predicted nucleic acid-binding protein
MIIDASVASHWFVNTEFSPAARPLAALPDLTAPSFLLVETANVLYKRSRRGEITAEHCIDGIEALRDVVTFVLDSDLLAPATRLALEHLTPVYDCLYLALALKQREKLATADRRLATVAARLGVETLLVGPD